MSAFAENTWLLVMAGGSGTRFWPRSRAKEPKQTLRIVEDKTLLQATIDRFAGSLPSERIVIVTTESLRAVTEESVSHFNGTFLCEPDAKNTAPCIMMAMEWLRHRDPNAVAMVVPADHWIGDTETYLDTMTVASHVASEQAKLITVGIAPTRAETGYGYIRSGDPFSGDDRVNTVERFVEKPQQEVADTMIQDPQYFWNAGMFIWSVPTFFMEMQKTNGALVEAFNGYGKNLGTPAEDESLRNSYSLAAKISIDYALLEKSSEVLVLPGAFDWNDLGSFQSLYELYPDVEGGVGKAVRVMAIDSTNNLVDAPNKTVALLGVTNMMVIDTGDVILVAAKEKSQEVKRFVERLKAEKDPQGIL